MSKLRITNLKKDIYEGELIKIEFNAKNDNKKRLLTTSELIEKKRL